jgi:hypothetical protein
MSLTTALVMAAKPALTAAVTAVLAAIVWLLDLTIPEGRLKSFLFTHLWDTDSERDAKVRARAEPRR